MPWLLLSLGLVIWTAAHLFKRVAPERRAALGEPGKGLVACLLVVSLLLLIFGYRAAPFIPVWNPPSFFLHVNNLLMLIAMYVYLSTMAAQNLWIARIRHPQLIGFKTWAIAHLLVNGDLASVLLFGGLLAWAVVTVIRINKAEERKPRSERAPIKQEWQMVLAGLLGFGVVAFIHAALGKWPFPG